LKKHNHYHKDVKHLDFIDVYRVLELFNVTDPCIQHAVKKLLCAGIRGAKSLEKDYGEAQDSIVRALEMIAEDASSIVISIPGKRVIWPDTDDSPRQQRIEQSGELAEIYEVLDKMAGPGERG
jgi:hypothetical protein